MLMVISPAKTLDYDGASYPDFTMPAVLDQSKVLVEQLSTYDAPQLSALMKISDKLANLNQQRYQDFQTPFTPKNAKQALLVFKGDVYRGMAVEDYSEEDLTFAQKHLRILSGLYGILRPLDLMQPYRLEMGTKLATDKGKNLYEFWGTTIAELINDDLQAQPDPCLVNLASNEYFKSVNRKALKGRILNVAFKENKAGTYKVIAIHAKRARGLMVDYVIRNRIEHVEGMQGFDVEGYTFRESLSEPDNWVFCRD
ncbi:MAG: peroxide stress protein YaaA [Cyanobacteria bacterium P01_F01_bin.53]